MTEIAGPLFQPLSIGRLHLPGRLVKTATSETRASETGQAGEEITDFYLPIAEAGTPLIITGALYVSPDGQSTPRQMGAESDDRIFGLRALTSAVHKQGSLIIAQLSHSGRQVVPHSVGLAEALSPSSIRDLSTGTKPRALELEEIHRIAQEFGAAAGRCKMAGFDGVQIQAGHGDLVSQFLTPHTNRRRDAYGGSFMARTQFLRDVNQAIRAQVGADFPVLLKINGSDELRFRAGLKTKELVEVAKVLEGEGIDAVEVSVGHHESGFASVRGRFFRCLGRMVRGSVRHLPLFRRTLLTTTWPVWALASNILWPYREAFNLAAARRFKQALKIPVICVGGFRRRETMEAAIETGFCDAVSVGRGFIANPYLSAHLVTGTDGPQCVLCNACVGSIGTDPLDCHHPKVRAEKEALLAQGMPKLQAAIAVEN
ncbi:MAG: NADH:flavin oxidoreductase [Pseudomonadota bacterium]